MGLFDEIKRSLEEAINEAQGRPSTPPPRRRPTQPRPQPNIPKEPAPVPYEDQLESVQSRDRQRQISRRQQNLREQAAQERAAKESADRKRQEQIERARKRAEAERAEQARKLAAQRQRQANQADLGHDHLRNLLKNPGQLKEAIVLTEILGKPLSKRDPKNKRMW